MTSTLVHIRPASKDDASKLELDHFVCCRDYTRSLCSSPLEGELVCDDVETGNPMCVVCADLDRSKYCPCGLTCP